MENFNQKLKEAAKEYLAMGFSIIPVGIDKVPIVEWKEFQERKPTDSEVDHWFDNPNAEAIGLVTGSVSGGIVALDFEKGADWEQYKLPETVCSESGGGGKHFFFAVPEDARIPSLDRIFPLTDFRAEKKMIILPPSKHKSGGEYKWINKFEKDIAWLSCAMLPEWVLEELKNKRVQKKDWEKVMKGVDDGERNIASASLVGKFLRSFKPGEWETIAWPALKDWNEHCNPPLSLDRLETTFKSIASRELGRREEMEKQPRGTIKARIDQINESVEKISIPFGERKIPHLKQPEKEISKADWDEVVDRNFPDLRSVAEIELAAVAQLLVKDIYNPFGLVLVDVPSSGKTMTLNFLSELSELVITTDSFSPAALVSHASNIKKEELEKNDLLPQIKDKVFIIRDMITIFGMREDDLKRNMGLLTRVFDGDGLETTSGIHGNRGYKGTYMFIFIGASTPIKPRIFKILGTMGSRLFFVNIGSKEKDEETLADQLCSKSYKLKEMEVRKITAGFVRTLWSKNPDGIDWDAKKTEREILIKIGRLAKLLARLRTTIDMWSIGDGSDGESGKFSHTVPIREMPDRINQLLYNLARGHAVINGRNYLTEEDIKPILKITIESANFHRTKVFKKLVKKGGSIDSEEVQKFLHCTRPTALKEVGILVHLELVDKSDYGGHDEDGKYITITSVDLKKEFRWLRDAQKKWPDLFE